MKRQHLLQSSVHSSGIVLQRHIRCQLGKVLAKVKTQTKNIRKQLATAFSTRLLSSINMSNQSYWVSPFCHYL